MGSTLTPSVGHPASRRRSPSARMRNTVPWAETLRRMTSQDSPDFRPGPKVRIHLNGGPLDGEERTHHFQPKLYGEVGLDSAPISVYQPAEAIDGEPAVLPLHLPRADVPRRRVDSAPGRLKDPARSRLVSRPPRASQEHLMSDSGI
jgi:hypothetical protein